MRGNVLVRCGLELGGNPLLKGRNGRLPSISIIDRWECPMGSIGEVDTGKRYYQYRCWHMYPLVAFLPMDVSNDRSPWYSGGA
jgi:hypothetical protein